MRKELKMQLTPIIVLTVAAVILARLAARHFQNVDAEMSEMLADSKRTDMLMQEAMQRYPAHSKLGAVQQYYFDLENHIQTLRHNALNTDVVEALKSVLRDRTLLLQEISRMIHLEVENNSKFSVLTAARV
jgi:hypothetical protein